MVAGHLREKNGIYHAVLSYTDQYGKRHTPSKSTGLPVKGNKKRAEAILRGWQQEKENELEQEHRARVQSGVNSPGDVLFTQYMLDWLSIIRYKVDITTYAGYKTTITRKINPYFEKNYPGLKLREVTTKHIQDYYTYELEEVGLSANTVLHRHANIRKALQYAYTTDMILSNPAAKVERPRKEKFEAGFYNAQEMEQLFEVVRGDPVEFGVILAAYYGLRRSEVVGLRWDAIDFQRKTITIKHVVAQMQMDGKSTIIEKNRTKSKSSYRTLPLVAPFEELLHRMQAEQARNRKLCGSSYCKKDSAYIYVNELGERMKPNYLTQRFPKILEKNGMRRIRFHDLRHTCASLLYDNGVNLKDIQEWLGHSDISTTANIYTHLEYESKIESAQAILGIFPEASA